MRRYEKINFPHIQKAALLFIPIAHATASPINSVNDVIGVFNKFLGWFQTIFWIAVMISAFYAAFLFLMAGGSDDKLKQAKKQFMFTAIAIAVGLIAFGLVPLIKNILTPGNIQTSGNTTTSGGCPSGFTLNAMGNCVTAQGGTGP